MSLITVRPTTDVSGGMTANGAATKALCINQVYSQPTLHTAAGDTTFINCTNTALQRVNTDNIPAAVSGSSMTIWIDRSFTPGTGASSVAVALFLAGASIGSVTVDTNPGGGANVAGWVSAAFNGAWTPAQLADIDVQISLSSATGGTLSVWNCYADVTCVLPGNALVSARRIF